MADEAAGEHSNKKPEPGSQYSYPGQDEPYVCAAIAGMDEAKTYTEGQCDEFWHSVLAFERVFAVDVRNADELEERGAIAGAVHAPCRLADDPDKAIESIADYLPDDESMPLIVFCAVGGRAQRVRDALRKRGYYNCYNAGGADQVRRALNDHPRCELHDGKHNPPDFSEPMF